LVEHGRNPRKRTSGEARYIVLVRNDPRDVPRIIALLRPSWKMIQNLWWDPARRRALAPWGIIFSPAVGAVLMSASTMIVAINAQLLRRVELS
jgi:Cu2+-exporting ATPase